MSYHSLRISIEKLNLETLFEFRIESWLTIFK